MTNASRRALPSNVRAALAELKQALTDLYGERLRGLHVLGSYARGDFRDDSDVDVLLVLEGPVVAGREITRYNPVVADICLRRDLLIAIVPVADGWLTRRAEPLSEIVTREGVPV